MVTLMKVHVNVEKLVFFSDVVPGILIANELLAGRSDGSLGHVSFKSVQQELGAITLLREVCFDCYLLRLAWLPEPSPTLSRPSHTCNQCLVELATPV
jgi:hypothetical protein